jgi:D-alanyl-lipoteichoic acid acyltransferase DltB (MBOAT superfamily)
MYRNLMIVMLLGGLWHGANWTFVVWGAYHGALLSLHRIGGRYWDRLPAWTRRTATFVLVVVGFVFAHPTSRSRGTGLSARDYSPGSVLAAFGHRLAGPRSVARGVCTGTWM